MRAYLLAVPLLLLAYHSAPALAIECVNALRGDEKAICADPELKAADERLNKTYRRVSHARDATERRGLKALQEDWLVMRDRVARIDGNLDRQFLLDEINERRGFLERGEGIGPEQRGRLTYFSVDSPAQRNGDSWVHVSAFKFAVPRTPGELLLNTEIDKKIYYGTTHEIEDKTGCYCINKSNIFRAYLSDGLISVSINAYENNGGTHGWDETYYLNIDLKEGKEPEVEDFFKPDLLEQVVNLCRRNFRSPIADDLELDTRDVSGSVMSVSEHFRDTVLKLDNWAFSQTRAQIRFGALVLGGGYAQGEQFCTLPYADLTPLLKPRKVLPP